MDLPARELDRRRAALLRQGAAGRRAPLSAVEALEVATGETAAIDDAFDRWAVERQIEAAATYALAEGEALREEARAVKFITRCGDAPPWFAAALNEVRGVALSCDYEIPQPDAGEELDLGLVNVELTSGGETTTIPYVGSKAGCDEDGGWHYDVDPASGAPERIVACDTSCSDLKAASDGVVEIRVGCRTVGAPVIR